MTIVCECVYERILNTHTHSQSQRKHPAGKTLTFSYIPETTHAFTKVGNTAYTLLYTLSVLFDINIHRLCCVKSVINTDCVLRNRTNRKPFYPHCESLRNLVNICLTIILSSDYSLKGSTKSHFI